MGFGSILVDWLLLLEIIQEVEEILFGSKMLVCPVWPTLTVLAKYFWKKFNNGLWKYSNETKIVFGSTPEGWKLSLKVITMVEVLFYFWVFLQEA